MPRDVGGEIPPVVKRQGILFDLHIPAEGTVPAGSGDELQLCPPSGLQLDGLPLHSLPFHEQVGAEFLRVVSGSVDHFRPNPPSAPGRRQPASRLPSREIAIAAAGKLKISGVDRCPGPFAGASRGNLPPSRGCEIGTDEQLPLEIVLRVVALGGAQGGLDIGPFLAHRELPQLPGQLPFNRGCPGGKGDDANLVPWGKQLQQTDRLGPQMIEDARRSRPEAGAVRGVDQNRRGHRGRPAEPSPPSSAQGRTGEGEDERGHGKGAQQQHKPLAQADAAHAALVQLAQETEVAERKGLGAAAMQQVNSQGDCRGGQGNQCRGIQEIHVPRPAKTPDLLESERGSGLPRIAVSRTGLSGSRVTASLPPQSLRAPRRVSKPRSDSS